MKPINFYEKISKKIIFDRNIGIENTVFLASMGRSGSTFLSNLINCDNNFRILFEPFRFDLVDQARDFVYPFYLRPENSDSKYVLSAQKIVSGRIQSKWVNKENRSMFPKARLIKDIRANFFLKWLHNNFPEMKIILLLRHPCAVVNSWLSAKFGNGRIARRRLLSNSHFMADMDDVLLKEYGKATSDFERLVFLWCFSYIVPFRQFKNNDLHLLFYENLILHPKNEVKKIFQFIRCKYSEAEMLNSLSRPSSTTKKSAAFFSRDTLRVDRWKRKASSEQSRRAEEIMALFGMERLYCPQTSMPNTEAAAELFC